MEWCKQADVGLPRPDKVLHLTLSSEAAAKRGGFGEERYEQTDMQKRVAANFDKLKESYWQVRIDVVHQCYCKIIQFCRHCFFAHKKY